MGQITLSWTEAGQPKTQTLDTDVPDVHRQSPSLRIGRDPVQCDIVLPSTTELDCRVSRLHAEIVFNPSHQCFYLRNLKPSNPITVNAQVVGAEAYPLQGGSIIRMGSTELVVQSASAIPPTVVHGAIEIPETTVAPPETRLNLAAQFAASTPESIQDATPQTDNAVIYRPGQDHLFSCPKGHQYSLEETKELGWVCKYDGYLIANTYVAE